MAPKSKYTEATVQAFLDAYARTGVIGRSAHEAGVSHQAIIDWRKKFPEFDVAVKSAYEAYKELLHAEIHRRAVTGVPKPVFYQGEEVGEITEYSDRMLELLAKRHMPEFRDRYQVDMSVTPGVLAVPGMGITSREWEEQQRGPQPAQDSTH